MEIKLLLMVTMFGVVLVHTIIHLQTMHGAGDAETSTVSPSTSARDTVVTVAFLCGLAEAINATLALNGPSALGPVNYLYAGVMAVLALENVYVLLALAHPDEDGQYHTSPMPKWAMVFQAVMLVIAWQYPFAYLAAA
jgi:hypothetical protein